MPDDPPSVRKTPGLCGGRACVAGTRIPVWLLVLKWKMGESDDRTLRSYPDLTPAHLEASWTYYQQHPLEIERDIWWNDAAGNVGEGEPVPAEVIVQGTLLGLSGDEIRESFDPPLAADAVASAWAEYRREPTRFAPAVRQAG